MWQGLANCYTKLSRHTDAIKAYKRAVIGGSTDLSILVTLAQLLELEGDMKGAASFQSQIISETTVPGTGELTPMAAKAHLWLARMEMGRGDLEEAERHVNETLKGHYVLSPLCFRRFDASLILCSCVFSRFCALCFVFRLPPLRPVYMSPCCNVNPRNWKKRGHCREKFGNGNKQKHP